MMPPMLPWLSLALVLIATGAVLCAVTIFMMARMLLTPPRMTDGKAVVVLKRLAPSDLALGFEDLTWEIRDEATGEPLRVAGWWIPAPRPTSHTVLIIHGYSDAKVGGIAWAPMFHAMGWNILAIDLRAHGESGGVYSTAGYWERHDLNQVINRIREERQRETQTLVLFGVSLGAAVALAASMSRDDIAAMILEGPFADFRDAVAAHGRLFGAPGGWMQSAALKLAQSMARADFDAVRPVDLIPQAACPLMIIHACEDCFMLKGEAAALRAALDKRRNPRDRLIECPGAGHVLGLACDPAQYSAHIASFLSAALHDADKHPQETSLAQNG
jgi:alpha-beta hydrolase superfamily lysophospholipase